MRKINVKKLSLTGLVVLAASAIIAAMIPANTDPGSKLRYQNGELTTSDNGFDYTCQTRDFPEALNCHDTNSAGAGSSTTRAQQLTSANPTNFNTTGQDNS